MLIALFIITGVIFAASFWFGNEYDSPVAFTIGLVQFLFMLAWLEENWVLL